MNKKIKTIIVILCTVICVSIMLFSDQINNKANKIRDKILVINKKSNVHNEKSNIENSEIVEKDKQSKRNDSVQKEANVGNESAVKKNIASSAAMTEKYKKHKLDMINDQLEQDKSEFFYQDEPVRSIDKKDKLPNDKKSSTKQAKDDSQQDQNKKSVNNKEDLSGKDVSVFKVSRSKINEYLTISDKTKLLSVASKLSAIDYEKVNKYLESGSDEDVKNVIKLLKERLSEKDYDKVKEVARKFINMDAVEQ